MPVALTPRQRAELKARAHALEPAVYVGKAGVQDSIVLEVDRALTAHELIKMKIDADRDERESMAEIVADRTGATVVQRVGKVVVFWRPRPPSTP
jgi:putative YhbY family RNA-binding protein